MKTRINFETISIDTNNNKEGQLYNKLYVNFDNSKDNYYRIGEFLSFPEKRFLKERYNYDFDSIKESDITNNIQYIEVCKDESRYGIKLYLNVHFDIGYDKKINIENDDYFLLVNSYKFEKTNQLVREIKK